MQTTDGLALELSGVAFKYGRRRLFSDANLQVAAGEFHVLMGENGIGKTTLFRCLMGLASPTAGAINLFGRPVDRWNRRELYQRIGIVISSPEAYPWQLTAGGLLELSSRFYPAWDHAFVHDLTREFQIDLTKKLRHLSSGEHAKVRLLKALAFKPKLLLLDELTANLSSSSASAVTRAVIGLMTDHGSAALYISHSTEEAFRLSDHVHTLTVGGIKSVNPEARA